MSYRCKECTKQRARDWYARNAESIAPRNRERVKKWRRENRDKVNAYYRRRHAENPERQREYYREYYERNIERSREIGRQKYQKYKDKYRENLRRWRAENPGRAAEQVERRRALKVGAPVVESIDRSYIFERDGGRCHICDGLIFDGKFHLDHLVPLSKGGEHTARNLRVSHPSCNSRRGAGRIPAQLLLFG